MRNKITVKKILLTIHDRNWNLILKDSPSSLNAIRILESQSLHAVAVVHVQENYQWVRGEGFVKG